MWHACGRGEGHTESWRGDEGNKALGRPRRKWQSNIKTDIQEINWGTWAGLIWLWIGTSSGLVNTTMDFRLPWMRGVFLTGCGTVSFTSRTLSMELAKTIIIIIIDRDVWIFCWSGERLPRCFFVVLLSHPRKIPGYCLLQEHNQFLIHIFQVTIH